MVGFPFVHMAKRNRCLMTWIACVPPLPLTTAEFDGSTLTVPYDKDQMKEAPHHDPDTELLPAEEALGNTEPMRERVVPLLQSGGVDVVFSGHEHHVQCLGRRGRGVLRQRHRRAARRTDTRNGARTRARAAEAHRLHLRLGSRLTVTPLSEIDPDGTPLPMTTFGPEGTPVETPFVVDPARHGGR